MFKLSLASFLCFGAAHTHIINSFHTLSGRPLLVADPGGGGAVAVGSRLVAGRSMLDLDPAPEGAPLDLSKPSGVWRALTALLPGHDKAPTVFRTVRQTRPETSST